MKRPAVYNHPADSGKYGLFPWYKDGALLYDSKIYTTDLKPCNVCKSTEPARHMSNDKCWGCFRQEVNDLHFAYLTGEKQYTEHMVYPSSPETAAAAGVDWYYTGERCPNREYHAFKKSIKNGRCMGCEGEGTSKGARIKARKNGERSYQALEPCKECGGTERRTHDNHCIGCLMNEQKRPQLRHKARLAGDELYLPHLPCPNCGVRAQRRVDTNKCINCEDIKRRVDARSQTPAGLDPASRELMEQAPDLVLSKKDARAMGLKVYRTGKPCKNGHIGYRYVSTGNCIQCHRER